MQIRPFEPIDSPHIEQLLRTVWGDDTHSLNYYRVGPDSPPDSHRFLRTLVSEADGRLVGLGSVWVNPFHPHALYLGIHVHPAWRRQRIGQRLFHALCAYSQPQTPIQAALWETSVSGVRFLHRNGFQEVRRTYTPTLIIADVDTASFGRFESRCAEQGYRLESLSALAQNPDHEAKLAALLATVYTATHPINPPRQMELSGWIDLLHRDPPDGATSFIALYGDQYVALSTAHQGDSSRPTITWSGVAEGHRSQERELIVGLTLRQITQAARAGLREIEGEFDSTSPWAMIQLGTFPFQPAPCWLTFQHPAV